MNRRNIILLVNKGQVEQGNVVLLMLVLEIVNAWTRMTGLPVGALWQGSTSIVYIIPFRIYILR